jgi:hypothetical protein
MADAATPKSKRGPKPKPSGEVKRNNFTFRMCFDLRVKVMALSAKSGRPMSEEVEARLIASFDGPDLAERVAALVVEKMNDRA